MSNPLPLESSSSTFELNVSWRDICGRLFSVSCEATFTTLPKLNEEHWNSISKSKIPFNFMVTISLKCGHLRETIYLIHKRMEFCVHSLVITQNYIKWVYDCSTCNVYTINTNRSEIKFKWTVSSVLLLEMSPSKEYVKSATLWLLVLYYIV